VVWKVRHDASMRFHRQVSYKQGRLRRRPSIPHVHPHTGPPDAGRGRFFGKPGRPSAPRAREFKCTLTGYAAPVPVCTGVGGGKERQFGAATKRACGGRTSRAALDTRG
jgi:hypothetical protein